MRSPKFLATALSAVAALSLCAPAARAADSTVWLSSLDLSAVEQGWGDPHANKSVENHPLSIGGYGFEKGIGTHSDSEFNIALRKGSKRFLASVGVDDEVKDHPASIEFEVLGDGKSLWKSGVMRAGQAAKNLDLDVNGVSTLTLVVNDAGDGNTFDHADWANAKLEVTGEAPTALAPPREEAVILTPKPAAAPRINGPKVFGVRPGSPFLFAIAATGERPMEFSATGLPDGLTLDGATGQITGSLKMAGRAWSHLAREECEGRGRASR